MLRHDLILAVLLALAASSDLASHRIPNSLTVSIAVTGVASGTLRSGALAGLTAVVASLVVAALLLPFWKRRLIGAGDLKLAAAAAAWAGLAAAPRLLVATAIAGGAVSALYYLRSGIEARAYTRANLQRLYVPALPHADVTKPRPVVPYGVAITVGAAFAVWGG